MQRPAGSSGAEAVLSEIWLPVDLGHCFHHGYANANKNSGNPEDRESYSKKCCKRSATMRMNYSEENGEDLFWSKSYRGSQIDIGYRRQANSIS